MTARRAPRVALFLLARLGPANEPLAGDLLEVFEATGSRWWLWRQVIAAIATECLQPEREIRPLRLVDRDPLDDVPHASVERREINLTASPVHGVGGLGLVMLAVAVGAVDTRVWSIALTAGLIVALHGLLLGVALIFFNRPPAHSSRVLFEEGNQVPPRRSGRG